MRDRIEEFVSDRKRLNSRIKDLHHLGINRYFNLDQAAYQDRCPACEDQRTARFGSIHGAALQ